MDKLHDIIVQPAKPFRALTPRDPLILRPWLMQPSGPGSHQAPLAQLQEARIAPGCLRAKLFSRLFYYYFTKYYFLLSPFSPSLLHLSSFSSCPTSSLLHPSSLSLSRGRLSFLFLLISSLPPPFLQFYFCFFWLLGLASVLPSTWHSYLSPPLRPRWRPQSSVA